MLATLRRSATSVVCFVAIVCASFAWMAIVYLHTWADPETPARVVSAVLADDEARDEIVTPLTERLDRVDDSATEESTVASVIDVVLADPTIRDRIADAYAPVDGDGGARSGAAVDELVGAVADLDPAVADRIAEIGPALSLPDVSPLAAMRPTAERWAWRLATLALALFAVAFAVGDRRLVVRRYGWWAIGTGASWWLGPLLVVAAARRWLPSFDATTSVVVDASVGLSRPWAIGLALSGVFVSVLGLVLRGRGPTDGAPERADIGTERGTAPVGLDETVPIPVVATPTAAAASIGDLRGAHGAPIRSLDDIDVWAAYAAPAPSTPDSATTGAPT